jgi:hypothetical protein
MRVMRTLGEVRTICTRPLLGKQPRSPKILTYFQDELSRMMSSKNPYISKQGSAFYGMDPELLGSFLSEINSNLSRCRSGQPSLASSAWAGRGRQRCRRWGSSLWGRMCSWCNRASGSLANGT